MSNQEEQRKEREWQRFNNETIPEYQNKIALIEEDKSKLDKTKRQLIRELAEKCLDFMPSEDVSRFLKKKLQDIVKPDTVEDALGKESKRKHESLPRDSKPETPVIPPKKEIEVSSGGSESYTKPDGSEEEREPEPNLAQADSDLEIRLQEALKLADDKDKALERERIKFANLEVELGNKANPPSNKVDANEELQIKYDELKQAYDELLEVERLRTSHSDFKSAAALPKQAWIAAINVFGLSRALTKISMNLDSDSSAARLKVLFDVTSEGQIKNPRLEGDVT